MYLNDLNLALHAVAVQYYTLNTQQISSETRVFVLAQRKISADKAHDLTAHK